MPAGMGAAVVHTFCGIGTTGNHGPGFSGAGASPPRNERCDCWNELESSAGDAGRAANAIASASATGGTSLTFFIQSLPACKAQTVATGTERYCRKGLIDVEGFYTPAALSIARFSQETVTRAVLASRHEVPNPGRLLPVAASLVRRRARR